VKPVKEIPMKPYVYLAIVALFLGADVLAEPVVPAIPPAIPATLVSLKDPPAEAVPQLPGPEQKNAPAVKSESKEQAIAIKPGKDQKNLKKKNAVKKRDKEKHEETAEEEVPQPRDQLVEGLRAQIKALEDKQVVNDQVNGSIQRPVNAFSVESKTIYTYVPDAIYLLYGAINHVVDIQLQSGEVLTGKPVAGDTVRWVVDTTISGGSGTETVHILVKPVQRNLETNFLITTNRHVYRIYARSSGNFFIPTMGWVYPQDEAVKTTAARKEETRLQEQVATAAPVSPESLNFKYRVKPEDDYPWTPVRVFDDGSKTYIQMSQGMKHSEAPTFFIMEGKDLILVNYRLKGDYFVIDRLFEKGELRSGTKDVVKIERKKPWSWSKEAEAPQVP
jgi:type IV secretion system protein TrbG